MSVGRVGHAAALLDDGRVLIAGGYSASATGEPTFLASAELYDPATGTFSKTGSMTTARAGATMTVLRSGVVLVAGGYFLDDASSPVALASAELYDPARGTFKATGSLTTGRYDQTATLLEDGRVLIAGGSGSDGGLSSAELYDPAGGTFTATGSMATDRTEHAAASLPGGWVLMVGGLDTNAPANPEELASAEMYGQVGGKFVAAGAMTTARDRPSATALDDGSVLVCGGLGGASGPSASIDTCERYDLVSGAFTPAGSMSSGRSGQVAVLLADGRVLIAGGIDAVDDFNSSYPASAELYDPSAGSFSSAGSMATGRRGATATRLSDGRVLIAGGENSERVNYSAELYEP
jgi:N-acetylneuraminic acid mutarotase